MKNQLLFPVLAAAVLTFFSCQKADVNPAAPQEQNAAAAQQTGRYVIIPTVDDEPVLDREGDPNCIPTEVMLVAGQTIDAGTVTVSNDANYIYVTYTTTNGWLLTQTHLYVGDCALIPLNNPGNPVPGQFPYAGTHNRITSYTYTIPISQIPAGNCGCIAAHAVVVKVNGSNQVTNQETAWGNGTRINMSGGNWGMKFDFCSCTPL